MKALCCFLILSLFPLISSRSLTDSLHDAFAAFITRRHLGQTKEPDTQSDGFEISVDTRLKFPNPRLKKAYYALQSWKKVIYSDPENMIKNWEGADVCSYNGVFCANAPDDPNTMTVAGIDLNHGDIAGQLVPHLGLLTDLSVFHINSNRFCGIIPDSFAKLTILNELDVSNNRFVGQFPKVVLKMPKLKYLDIRYNNFEGDLPPQLFDMDLDAIFLNHNRFCSLIPENIGNSSASVILLADNDFKGCIPKSIGKMSKLDEVIFSDNELAGCVPDELGLLENIKVLDLSKNSFVGTIPDSFQNLKCVEMIDLRKNELIGKVVDNICTLPKLLNFTFSDNYFDELEPKCEKPVTPVVLDCRENCLPNKPDQRSEEKCDPVVNRVVDCDTVGCKAIKSDEESKKRKVPKKSPPPVQSPPPPVHSPPPPVFSPPPPSPMPPPPPPPVPTPPPFEDIALPPKIGGRYPSPPPPIHPGY